MTARRFDLYSLPGTDPERHLERVGKVLGVDFQPRTSDYQGDYYLAGVPGDEHFELKANRDGEGERIEPEFPEAEVLLYVNETPRSADLASGLAEVEARLLRSESLST